ncbi:MAG: TonB-dependent receptor, partial [Gammaproteobacteria bacterium]|nr:TonB-dependent receptor [Gammaproteobacteria bacterium]
IEGRINDRVNRNHFITPNLNAAFWWGETLVQFNTNYTYTDRASDTDSDRIDIGSNSREFIRFEHDEVSDTVEFSLDLERDFTNTLQGKGIFLYNINNEDFQDLQLDLDGSGNQTLFRVADGGFDSSELIARLEFDWLEFHDHHIQANAERAHNVLDSSLVQTDDIGTGPVPVDVPGANSRVEETRWDFLIKDNWRLDRFEFEYGLGAEASTIRQTGDAELVRNFFFLKPQMILNYSSLDRDQTRLRFTREIAQLNLEDFVSATEFLDDDVALGNPNIKPDATWKLELSHEKRFGRAGVIKLTLFHDWISDVLDLLPLTPDFEAPGNIGSGRRWGALGEGTLPLDWLGLIDAKLDFKLRIQDSTVVDPVTGKDRSLSIPSISGGPVTFDIENKYAFTLEFRQDIRSQQWAWGWELWERGKQLRFKVNELEIYNEGAEFRAFIETTRWWGIKMRIQGENILNFADVRQRRKFEGERDLSPLATAELRDQTRGARLAITFSGNF